MHRLNHAFGRGMGIPGQDCTASVPLLIGRLVLEFLELRTDFQYAVFDSMSQNDLKSYPRAEKNFYFYLVDDQELFQGLKNGDRVSVKTIYQNYLPSVKHWVMRNNGSESDAEDMFQEGMEILILRIEKLQSSLGGLIMQICKRRWIDKIRKEKRVDEVRIEALSRQEDIEGAESSLIEKEKAYIRHQVLEKAFAELSSLCQQLLTMIKKDFSMDEIVKELSFSSANTVYRRKAACMERWAILVKQDDNYNDMI